MTDIDALWDYSDPAASETRFRAALVDCKEPLERAEVLTQIARTLGLRKRFDEAAVELDSAEALLGAGASRARVRLLLERGRCLNSSGEPAAAVPLFEQAMRVAQEAHEPGLEVDAVHMLAIADADNSLEWNLKGIAMAETSSDPRANKWKASLYNNTGWSYFENGDVETALDYFKKAVPLRDEMGDKRNLDFARWCVARALRELGRAQEAFVIVEELVRDNPEDAYENQEMALCLVAIGRSDEALPYAEKAWNQLKDDLWMRENRADVLSALEAVVRG